MNEHLEKRDIPRKLYVVLNIFGLVYCGECKCLKKYRIVCGLSSVGLSTISQSPIHPINYFFCQIGTKVNLTQWPPPTATSQPLPSLLSQWMLIFSLLMQWYIPINLLYYSFISSHFSHHSIRLFFCCISHDLTDVSLVDREDTRAF